MASQYNVTITPYNDNEVNYHRIDSIYYTLWDSAIYYHIPRPIIFGEVINNSSFYTSSIGYIYRDSWSSLSGFSHEIFDWDNIGDRYLGIRMNISDTLYYGWIRLNISTGVTVGGASQVTVKEYALSKSLSAGIFGPYHSEKIKVYPNPLYTDLNILLPQHFNSGNILILDVNGATRRSKRILNSGLITINVSDFESGFYTLRIVGDSNMFYSKIIKH